MNVSAFKIGFNQGQNLQAWTSVTAVPLSKKCHENTKVCREFGDADNNQNNHMVHIH